MNKKTIIATATVATLLLGSATSAMAYGHRGDRGGDGYMGRGNCGSVMMHHEGRGFGMLPPEQQEEFSALARDFALKQEPKRVEVHAKRLELRALSNNPNAKPETISQLSKDIARLESELRREHDAFRQDMDQKFDFQRGERRGQGPHHGYRR